MIRLTRKKKVFVAILLLAVCCVPLLFRLLPTRAGVSLHLLRLQTIRDSYVVSFAISNETHSGFSLIPVRLERFDGNTWKNFPLGVIGFSLSDRQVEPSILSCTVPKVTGRLRIVAQHQVWLKGLTSFVHRVGLHLRGDHRLSLNPFDKTVIVRWDRVEVISEPFEEQ